MSAPEQVEAAGGSDPSAYTRTPVTDEQVKCLTEMLLKPRLCTQRCVEHLAFIPAGGHQWTRDLQIKIPRASAPQEPDRRIISLGAYARRRFPDFTVVDGDNQRLSLLTRDQHGFALTQSTINKLVTELSITDAADERSYTTTSAYKDFWQALYSFLTTSGQLSDAEKHEVTERLTELYDLLLSEVERPPDTQAEFVKAFTTELVVELLDITRYLCWVEASPGDVIDLRVTYSTSDPRRKLGRGTIASRLATLSEGITEPRVNRWKVWAGWYRQFGLAPLNYEFSVPGSLHVGSYYFMLEPPPGTGVTYLDWELGNSLENRETDCSALSAHIHNHNPATHEQHSEPLALHRGGTIQGVHPLLPARSQADSWHCTAELHLCVSHCRWSCTRQNRQPCTKYSSGRALGLRCLSGAPATTLLR